MATHQQSQTNHCPLTCTGWSLMVPMWQRCSGHPHPGLFPTTFGDGCHPIIPWEFQSGWQHPRSCDCWGGSPKLKQWRLGPALAATLTPSSECVLLTNPLNGTVRLMRGLPAGNKQAMWLARHQDGWQQSTIVCLPQHTHTLGLPPPGDFLS